MLMIKSHVLIAQMGSEDVDKVKDFKIGLKHSKAQYIRIADLAVANLSWLQGESEGGLTLERGVEAVACKCSGTVRMASGRRNRS